MLDTFVSFEYSQYHPTGFHLLVGKQSHFLHGFTDSELRRSGSMTARQKRKRARLEALHGRPDPRSTEKEVAELLRTYDRHSDGVQLSVTSGAMLTALGAGEFAAWVVERSSD